MELSSSPVKTLALARGTPVYQPEKLRDGAALETIRALAPDILAVVAYGRLLPDELLAVPKFGAVNVHASLLPKYRGSAPIQWRHWRPSAPLPRTSWQWWPTDAFCRTNFWPYRNSAR